MEEMIMKLEALNIEYRDRVDEIAEELSDLIDEIDSLVDDYCKTRKTAETMGVDFEEDMFHDYAGWIEDLENLKEYVNTAHIFS